MSTGKNKKFDLSEGDYDFNLSSSDKLLNITKLHKDKRIKNNIFDPTILLETIISDLEILEKRIDVMENLVSKALALGVAIEKKLKMRFQQ